jgi:tRNA1Val (adenine37-N6)-methyltransferase
MSNSFFSFRQFTIQQDQCAMKVGTDGVLLGAWVNVENARRILDAGTGTGLIALMCAQRSNAVIHAVEIDPKASEQAVQNSTDCPWHDRITIYNDSFQHFAITHTERYNVIVSNPPYFRNSLKSPNSIRTLARHDKKLSYESLLHYAVKLLEPGGRLALIIPDQEISRLTDLAYFKGLHPQRQTHIRPYRAKNYSRCLIEFTGDINRKYESNELIIKEENSREYTMEYKELTKDFYFFTK